MTALLNLESRVAGTTEIDPTADFADATWVDMHDRARCVISYRTHTRIC